jgi:hypothetical protein
MYKAPVAALAHVLLSAVATPALHAQPLQGRSLLDPAITVLAGDRSHQDGSSQINAAGQPGIAVMFPRDVGPTSSVSGFPESDMGSAYSGLGEVAGAPTANGTGGGH